ncbi:ATP-binding cassette domain-containing protein [Scrofimicrobium sp. R131]|uniref:ATP-binding cassette domain-containing protein n=1 Tax=Scrofimicrobium appendicitidis TaxID=3079930 RepID=A0AAU7V5N4_9ACTO
MATLRLQHLGKTYPGTVPVEALRDVSLTIQQGEYVAIEGPSGSGKSTLLNQLALLDSPSTGEYYVDELATSDLSDVSRARIRSSTFAFIFQSFHLLDGRTVEDNVALGTLYRALPEARRLELAREALGFVGLAHKAEQKAANLSGGERQRVAIARAIASGAPVVVADEPTGNLDSHNSGAVLDTLERLNQGGATVILVTHDPGVANRAHRRLRVLDGVVTDESQPELAPSSVPLAPMGEGTESRVRIWDGLKDAWRGLAAKKGRTAALIGSVALGVGLALTTIGLSQTASGQVSDLFDAQRNQRVAMASPSVQGTADTTAGQVLIDQAGSLASLNRLKELAGVEDVAVFVTHASVPVQTRPSAGGPDGSSLIDVVGLVEGQLPNSLFTVDRGAPGLTPLTQIDDDQVIIGSQIANQIELGPVLGSPVVWIGGVPKEVVGILTDAGLQINLLNSIITTERAALIQADPSYASVELRVAPGAAQQVGLQGPVAWIPAAPDQVQVDAPPDPVEMREQIESNVATMLYTLTGVALLAAVLSLTSSMTTAVFQRTGEFGLRRAIGARRKHITGLVLTESLIIGLVGGVVGAYTSILVILGITLARHWQPVLHPALVPIGILGGIVVGLFGGLFATRRAAKIEPSDALRTT